MLRNSYPPSAPVFTRRTNPVSVFCRVTIASLSAAPLESRTVPEIVPVISAFKTRGQSRVATRVQSRTFHGKWQVITHLQHVSWEQNPTVETRERTINYSQTARQSR